MNVIFSKSRVVLAVLAASMVSIANASTVSVASGGILELRDPAGSDRTANIQLISGSGTYEFSNGTGVPGGVPATAIGGLVGAINVAKVVVTGVDNAVVTQDSIFTGRDFARAAVKVGATVTGLTADDQTGEILSVSSVGGANEQAPYLGGVLDGGNVVTKNLRFDLQARVVYADMIGTPLVYNETTGMDEPGETFTALGIPLWTIGSIAGPTTLPPQALLAAADGQLQPLTDLGYNVEVSWPGYFRASAIDVLSGLRVTDEGFQFFAKALGLSAGSTGHTALAAVNAQPDGWGSVTSKITFSSAVPEPSTYVLMGIGLVGLAAVARRRRSS